MSDWREKEVKRWHAAVVTLGILLLCIWLLLASGCKVIEKEVPVVVEHTSTQRTTDIVRDTLMMRDSVYHYVQGDTLRIERWHYTTRVEVVERTDTLRDSIPVITEVATTKEVAKPMAWWQKLFIGIGLVALGFVGYKTVKFFS